MNPVSKRAGVGGALLLLVSAALGACSGDDAEGLPNTQGDAAMNTDAATNTDAAVNRDSAVDMDSGVVVDAGGPPTIGSACTTATECDFANAECLTELRPLAALTDNPDLIHIGVAFPDGYCSKTPNCQTDADCGPGGGCFWPLEHVTSDVVAELGTTLSLDLSSFAELGICMKRCTASTECRDGYECVTPIGGLLSLVPNATLDTFCVGIVGCEICLANSVCDDSGPTPFCSCVDGYEGDPLAGCTPIGGACGSSPCPVDECADNTDNCSADAVCADTTDSFTCTCNQGFVGDGVTCQIEVTCSQLTCHPLATCDGSGVSPACVCPSGYSGDGVGNNGCVDIDECALNTDACTATQRCANTAGSSTCTACGANASGSGSATQPETCLCNANFAGDGVSCAACVNGGTSVAGSAACTCPMGYSGTTCSTVVVTSCGTYTDVVYSIVAGFAIKGTTAGFGNQAFTGLSANATTPLWGTNGGSGNHSQFERPPYVGTTTFTRGFARLRYTNDSAGVPLHATANLVELYVPLEFHQTAGAVVDVDTDHSVGLIDSTLTNCGGGDAACTNHVPAVVRPCTAGASATFTANTLNWGTCTAPSGNNSWSFAMARNATGAGCARQTGFGNTRSNSGLVPASGKGDSYQTWNQQLKPFVFNGADPLTATFTMAEMQVPNGTGASNTWMQITSSTVIATDCGTTIGTDLVCDVQ